MIDTALEVGISFLDTADVYGGQGESERLLGESLLGRRDDAVLATKFGMDWGGGGGHPSLPPGSRAAVRRAAEGSLRRLRTDRIDLPSRQPWSGRRASQATRHRGRRGHTRSARSVPFVRACPRPGTRRGRDRGSCRPTDDCLGDRRRDQPGQVRANAGGADWMPAASDLAELDQIFPPPGAEPPQRDRGRVGRWLRQALKSEKART